MKVLTADSKVWWLAKADEIRATHGIPVMQGVKRLMEAFEFAQAPTGLPGPNDGYKFQEGRFAIGTRSVAIKELVVFGDGISIEAYSGTEDNLLIMERFLEVGTELGLRKPITPAVTILQSMIVFEYPGPINGLAGHYDDVSKLIGEKIGVAGQHQLRVIEFAIDPATLPKRLTALNPTTFRLERRANEDYDKNRFYSFANTHTENHFYILEHLEPLLSK